MTDTRGVTVGIRSFCFTPTILRIRPGQTVTWVNHDGFPHTVMGANAVWGSFAALRRGRQITYRFPRPGVYPYVCTLHPGMVGAVVVGGGNGAATPRITTWKTGPILELPSPEVTVAQDRRARTPVEPAGGLRGTVIGMGLLSILAVLAVAIAVRRRRGRVSARTA